MGVMSTGIGASILETEAVGGSVAVLLGLIIAVSGILALITGCLGVRAANDPRKCGLLFVIAIISVVFTIFAMIAGSITISAFVGLAVDVIMLVLIYKVREEGKKMQ